MDQAHRRSPQLIETRVVRHAKVRGFPCGCLVRPLPDGFAVKFVER
jgi:hypothetical protein